MVKRNEPKGKSPMDAALSYLSTRARTVREVETKLDSLDYGEGDIAIVIARLIEIGLLDDKKYAYDFVSTRLATRPLSRRKLRDQLYAHMLPADIIDDAVCIVDDAVEAANALAVAEKFARQFMVMEDQERKIRVTQRLIGRGFEYDASKTALEQLFGDAQGLETCTQSDDDED